MSRSAQRPGRPSRSSSTRRWSQRVTRESDALDIEPHIFTNPSPRRIAQSLKRSALRSRRRKSDALRSALSMLSFYINRAGSNLSATRRARLQRAKDELRRLFGRPAPRRAAPRASPKRRV